MNTLQWATANLISASKCEFVFQIVLAPRDRGK